MIHDEKVRAVLEAAEQWVVSRMAPMESERDAGKRLEEKVRALHEAEPKWRAEGYAYVVQGIGPHIYVTGDSMMDCEVLRDRVLALLLADDAKAKR